LELVAFSVFYNSQKGTESGFGKQAELSQKESFIWRKCVWFEIARHGKVKTSLGGVCGGKSMIVFGSR
jgi:hypothetical protein